MNSNLFAQMMIAQDRLNSRINESWMLDKEDYLLAAVVETVEAIDYLPWKWWSNTDKKVDQGMLKLELIDIWFFLLSASLLKSWQVEDFVESTRGADSLDLAPKSRLTYLKNLLDALINDELDRSVYTLFRLFRSFDMTLEDVYVWYTGKSVLNTFRQNKGYKQGFYNKVWNGVEDNQHLIQILSRVEFSNQPQVLEVRLLVLLEEAWELQKTKES